MGEFNPKPHLIDIRGKQYLEVKWRLVWLRQAHPDWAIDTELLDITDPVIVRATLRDTEGRLIASGHAEYPRGRQFPSIMKAETSAIGRALAHAGFGTQFAGEDVEEPDLVDAPVQRPLPERAAANGAPARPAGQRPLGQRPVPPRPVRQVNAERRSSGPLNGPANGPGLPRF
jgi:hypothetical protein